jgi:5-methylcytosine-specific restriction endonuclease McrA
VAAIVPPSQRHALLRIAMAACPVCGRETSNPKYCSRVCAAKQNNVLFPKRRLGGQCALCRTAIPLRAKYCREHKPNKPLDRSLPICAVYKAAKHPSYRRSRLREDARAVYLANAPYQCVNCGYAKHIEVCHKRSLASFPDDTPISVVNSPSNLVGLCPNCHWELDHGHLQL